MDDRERKQEDQQEQDQEQNREYQEYTQEYSSEQKHDYEQEYYQRENQEYSQGQNQEQNQGYERFSDHPELPKQTEKVEQGVPMGFLDVIYGIIFSPVGTFTRFAGRPPLAVVVSLMTFLVLAYFLVYSQITPDIARLQQELQGSVMFVFWIFLMVMYLILFYFIWFIEAGIFHVSAKLLGGKGSFRSVFAVCGLCMIPFCIFIIPVYALLPLLLEPTGSMFNTIDIFLNLVLCIWTLVLLVIGFREVHRFSTGRAFMAFLLPIIVLFGLIFLFVVLFSVTFMQGIRGFL